MTNGLRLLGMTGTIVAVAVVAALCQPEWAEELGLQSGVWRLMWPSEQMTAERLAEGNQTVLRRREAKKQIAWNLVDGRVTLFEAAAAFRHWNNEYPQLTVPSEPGDSAEERLCRQVIEWVRKTVPERDPEGVEHYCEPLEEQLRRHKEQYGKVILPGAVTR
jgi:hypothetical protein